MKCASLLLLAGLVAAAQETPVSNPAEEYKARLRKVQEALADEHFDVGKFLSSQGMHAWAREEYDRARKLNPDHAAANQKLGYRFEDGQWVFDPSISVELQNKKRGDDAIEMKVKYHEKLEKLGKDMAKKWIELGNFCGREKMEEEARAAFRNAVEYDPTNAVARKKLGFIREGKEGPWLLKEEIELRKEMANWAKKGPPGKPSSGKTKVEEDLGFKHNKRASEHFLFESAKYGQDKLKTHVQIAEHAYAMFHKIFKLENLFQEPLNFVMLDGQPQHDAYIDRYHQGNTQQKDFAKKANIQGGYPRAELWLSEDHEDRHDTVVHVTTEELLDQVVGGRRLWISEGLAFYFTTFITGSARTYCVDMAGTSAGGEAKRYDRPEDWPIVIRQWLREGKDPDIVGIFKCKNAAEFDGAEAVKAWSMVEFLLTEHRDRFLDFLGRLRGTAMDDDEKTFKEVFGWTLDEFDNRWRAYARTNLN